MTVKTAIDTEELEPGDLVSHEDIPSRLGTCRVAYADDAAPGSVVVIWSDMTSSSVKSERLRMVERPEAYAVVKFEGWEARTREEITIDPYTFIVTGDIETTSDDVAIYQDAPRYRVVSFRLGREESPEAVSE